MSQNELVVYRIRQILGFILAHGSNCLYSFALIYIFALLGSDPLLSLWSVKRSTVLYQTAQKQRRSTLQCAEMCTVGCGIPLVTWFEIRDGESARLFLLPDTLSASTHGGQSHMAAYILDSFELSLLSSDFNMTGQKN